MSEAIILYRGRGGISEEDKRPKVYTNNGVFKAPFTGNYLVSCVGGGGGGGGGCRNIWNSSQVYYGAGGSRGGFSSGNVWLNQGDEVTMTMGPGGNAGTNNTTVVSYNSRGTSGSAGSTTTFGSHKSGSGGSAGSYSWMYRTVYNQNLGWSNTITGYTTKFGCTKCLTDMDALGREETFTPSKWDCIGKKQEYRCKNGHTGWVWHEYNGSWGKIWYTGNCNIINSPTWSNTIRWNNGYTNSSTRCYTSIQTGTWWYLNNNVVSTAGTRAYSGDGGQSGSKGNAGFILIYPQWSE